MRPTDPMTDPNEPPIDPRQGAALWRQTQAAFAAPATGEALDSMTLAAYLDGRLDAVAAEQVEARLAADPAALTLFLAADESLGATQAVPAALLARAGKLVPASAENRYGFIGRLFGARDRSGGFRLRPALLAASLMAILVVSVAGFEIGRFGYAVAEEAYFPATDDLAQAANNGF